MSIRITPSAILVLLLVWALSAVPPAAAGEVEQDAAVDLTRAIEASRADGPPGFRLRVDATTGNGFRSLEVFPSGVAIWHGELQLILAPAVRSKLLAILLEQDFAALAASYGGREDLTDSDGGLRVIRRVALDVRGFSKTSIQLADGEQSKRLERLAEALLDLVQPLAVDGVGASGLADGLDKLARGILSPETLTLRFVELPEPADAGVGAILRIEAGVATWQAYAPGRLVGEPLPLALDRDRFTAIVAALRAAAPESLPVNLWSSSYRELEVAVLGHRRSVMARPFGSLSPDADPGARRRFERLVETLRGLAPTP